MAHSRRWPEMMLKRSIFALVLSASAACLLGVAAPAAHAIKFAELPLGPDRTALFVYDDIEPGDERKLAAKLAPGRYNEIWLSSGGGSVGASYRMGRQIRQSRVPVRVPSIARLRSAFEQAPSSSAAFAAAGYVEDLASYRARNICASACGMLLAGGLIRFVDEGGSVGVHSATAGKYAEEMARESGVQSVERDNQGMAVRWSAYMQEMGLSLSYVAAAAEVPAACMYYLSFREMRGFNVTNVKDAPTSGRDGSYCQCTKASGFSNRACERRVRGN